MVVLLLGYKLCVAIEQLRAIISAIYIGTFIQPLQKMLIFATNQVVVIALSCQRSQFLRGRLRTTDKGRQP